eukprot:3838232-Rhodomonas_salina.1
MNCVTDTLDEEPSKAPLPLANGPAGAASYYSLAQMEKAARRRQRLRRLLLLRKRRIGGKDSRHRGER